jgi:hypothetical protein
MRSARPTNFASHRGDFVTPPRRNSSNFASLPRANRQPANDLQRAREAKFAEFRLTRKKKKFSWGETHEPNPQAAIARRMGRLCPNRMLAVCLRIFLNRSEQRKQSCSMATPITSWVNRDAWANNGCMVASQGEETKSTEKTEQSRFLFLRCLRYLLFQQSLPLRQFTLRKTDVIFESS